MEEEINREGEETNVMRSAKSAADLFQHARSATVVGPTNEEKLQSEAT